MQHRITLSTNLLVVLAASKNRNTNRKVEPKADGIKPALKKVIEESNGQLVIDENGKIVETELLLARA